MTGDKVQAKEYMVRPDGVTLYRFAVPNIKNEETGEWAEPKFMIKQDQTDLLYDVAIDVEDKGYTYTETDIPVEGQEPTEDEQAQKAEAYDYLTGRANDE